jgi:cell division protein FtsL
VIAPHRRTRTYPVLLPQEPGTPPGARRAPRIQPQALTLTLAALVLAALLGHVALQAGVAKAGVRLRNLRTEISQLERDRARLDAHAAEMRAPARIERIAIEKLGMRPPASSQLAAVPVRMPARPTTASREHLVDRIRGWFVQGQAAAQEQAP